MQRFGSSCTRVWQGLIEGQRLGRVHADHCSAKLKGRLFTQCSYTSDAAGAVVGRVAPAVPAWNGEGGVGEAMGAWRGLSGEWEGARY